MTIGPKRNYRVWVCADRVYVSQVPRKGCRGPWERRGWWGRGQGASVLAAPFGDLGGRKFRGGGSVCTCFGVLCYEPDDGVLQLDLSVSLNTE